MKLVFTFLFSGLVRSFDLTLQDESSMLQLQAEATAEAFLQASLDSIAISTAEAQEYEMLLKTGFQDLVLLRKGAYSSPILAILQLLIEAHRVQEKKLAEEQEEYKLRMTDASRASESDNATQIPGLPQLDSKKLKALITVSMLSLRVIDGTINKCLKMGADMQPTLAKRGKELFEVASKIPTHVDSWTGDNLKLLKNLEDSVTSYLALMDDKWKDITNLAKENMASIEKFYSEGPGKSLPLSKEIASAHLGSIASGEINKLVGPSLDEMHGLVKGLSESNPNDAIRAMKGVMKPLNKAHEAMLKALKPALDEEKQHKCDKILADIQKSPLGKLMPQKYIEINTVINRRFMKSTHLMLNYTLTSSEWVNKAMSVPGLEPVEDKHEATHPHQLLKTDDTDQTEGHASKEKSEAEETKTEKTDKVEKDHSGAPAVRVGVTSLAALVAMLALWS